MRRHLSRYDSTEVARLARERRVVATGRVVAWLANHDCDVFETIVAVLCSLEEHGRWIGSAKLRNGETADEYVVERADGDWYVKFYVDGETVVVNVWSCCWDGTVH